MLIQQYYTLYSLVAEVDTMFLHQFWQKIIFLIQFWKDETILHFFTFLVLLDLNWNTSFIIYCPSLYWITQLSISFYNYKYCFKCFTSDYIIPEDITQHILISYLRILKIHGKTCASQFCASEKQPFNFFSS